MSDFWLGFLTCLGMFAVIAILTYMLVIGGAGDD